PGVRQLVGSVRPRGVVAAGCPKSNAARNHFSPASPAPISNSESEHGAESPARLPLVRFRTPKADKAGGQRCHVAGRPKSAAGDGRAIGQTMSRSVRSGAESGRIAMRVLAGGDAPGPRIQRLDVGRLAEDAHVDV